MPLITSKMAPHVLYRVCYSTTKPSQLQKDLISVKPAILHSFRRHKVLHYDYPAIVPSPSSTVRGTIISGLTDGDLWRLNIFEGDEYKRRMVKTKILDRVENERREGNIEGEKIEVNTYIWIVGEKELEEGEWDFAEFTREKMGRWVGGSEEYDGESLRPSILGWCRRSGNKAETDDVLDVDQAVAADPTGGRGRGGIISGTLDKAEEEKKLLESAV